MNTTMQDVIERQITVRAGKERVFNAIVDPTQIVAWFPDRIEGKIAAGERPILDFGDDGKQQIYVVAVDPHDYFAYRWLPGCNSVPSGSDGDVLAHPNTLVEFRLHEGPAGTVVTLKESGFSSLPANVAEQSLKDNTSGWEFMMDRLATLLAKE